MASLSADRPSEVVLAARVARQFYLEGVSKVDIADRLGISRIARNFLFVLVDHRRIDSLAAIIQQFEDVVDERLGFARADVASATRLEDGQAAVLTAQLERLKVEVPERG